MGLLTKVLELITAVICWVTAQEHYLATRGNREAPKSKEMADTGTKTAESK